MSRGWTVLALLLTVPCINPAPAQAQDLPPIPFEKYTLDNGLQVILHEDHSLPVAAVNVWYHVGSGNEKPGRTGFAHLFEHMMFQGSEHCPEDYFLPLERVGAFVNGSTNENRTNYLEDVPSEYLERALWMEADRMGFLLPALTEEKLANQRDVVMNEKREGDNEPYALADELLARLAYPPGHPYSHTVIGSLEDLAAASFEDVSEFFRTYYAPNNASLCVVGDFDPAQVRQWIRDYFGPIPPGRPVERVTDWAARLDDVRRATAEDNVELARIYILWPSPALFRPGDAECDLLASVLSSGKSSRLYKTLVYEEQIAQDVSVYQASRELGSEFTIVVTARKDRNLDELEALIDRELRRIQESGVSEEELRTARTGFEANFFRSLERKGGFYGVADLMNSYNVRTGNPGYFREDLARYRRATRESVRQTARSVLDLNRRVILRVVPQGDLRAEEPAADRPGLPAGGPAGEFRPPDIQTATLSNGLKLYLVEKSSLPLVEVDLVVRSGWSSDPAGKAGTASLTADLLDEGTSKRSALQISEEARAMGARFGTWSNYEGSALVLNVLRRELDAGLELMSDVLLHPSFAREELDRRRQIYLGRIQQELSQPSRLAYRAIQKQLFGEGHPYAQPSTGTGTPASLSALTREDITRFHQAHYHPNNAFVVVAGDLTLAEAVDRLERAFGRWEPGECASPIIPQPQAPSAARVVLVDRPGAPQSYILAGQLGLGRADPDYLAFEVLNTALGAEFISRINMNLREEKGLTYGAYSFPVIMGGSGMFVCAAPVQTSGTEQAVTEILKEMQEVRASRPLSEREEEDAKTRLKRAYPRSFQTLGDLCGQITDLLLHDLPLAEMQTRLSRIDRVSARDLARVAREKIRPDDMVVVVVGDRSKVEEGLRTLSLGEMDVVNASGL